MVDYDIDSKYWNHNSDYIYIILIRLILKNGYRTQQIQSSLIQISTQWRSLEKGGDLYRAFKCKIGIFMANLLVLQN